MRSSIVQGVERTPWQILGPLTLHSESCCVAQGPSAPLHMHRTLRASSTDRSCRSHPVTNASISSLLGCNDPALGELLTSKNMGLMRSWVRTLNFSRVNFQLFKELMGEICWDLSSGTEDLTRAGNSLNRLFLEQKTFPS